MDAHSAVTDHVREKVGHSVRLEKADADMLGHGRVEQVWRVVPVDPWEFHEFNFWHQSCERQWFETPSEAAESYCAKWKEWSDSQSAKVDYYADDSIEYTPPA